MFDALVNERIDTEGLEFETELADIEKLNEQAFAKLSDVTKASFYAIHFLRDEYELLNAGSALGEGNGPLLIAKKNFSIAELKNKTIAIPGKHTTANFLTQLFLENSFQPEYMLYNEIQYAVRDGKTLAGTIIHENRFTYQNLGLVKLADLGEYWKEKTNLLLPLGGIIAKKSLGKLTIEKLNRLIRKSVEFAFKNPGVSKEYVSKHAQEMDEEVMQQHIQLYVNHFSIDLGKEGENAVSNFFKIIESFNHKNL